MGVVVRLFFLMILASIILSFVLGWMAVLRARTHFLRSFGIGKKRPKDEVGTVIEGEYRVLTEEEKEH